mmetsp:Transcript_3502/g.5856  ORF Transcript_3502/g.5856 Transcript_3502/m.5856 type:complete len:186 (+) Transcript_3502:117-674(+)
MTQQYNLSNNETSSEGETSLYTSSSSISSQLGNSEALSGVTALYAMLIQEGLPPPCSSLPSSSGSGNKRPRGGVSNFTRRFPSKRVTILSRSDHQQIITSTNKSNTAQGALPSLRGDRDTTKQTLCDVSILGMEMLLLSCDPQPTASSIDGDDSVISGQTFDSMKYNKQRFPLAGNSGEEALRVH